MIDLIALPLGYLMRILFDFTNNYAFTIILFAVITKVVFIPLNVMVQKNSIKMVKLQPKVNEIATLYINDKDKAAEEQLALYKKEKYNPVAGVIPMLIQIPLIVGLINVVYNPLKFLLGFSQEIINSLNTMACTLMGVDTLGAAAQLSVAKLVLDPATSGSFASLAAGSQELTNAVSKISELNFNMFGLDLLITPTLSSGSNYFIAVAVIVLSSLLLGVLQNKFNVLQKEQGKLSQYGMTIFLTVFCLVFVYLVPIAVGIYWAVGNLVAILMMFVLNSIYPPSKYIDYEALQASKKALESATKAQKEIVPVTKEQKKQAKEDYKRFFSLDNEGKELVFFSGAGGTYKYYRGVIEHLLNNTDIVIHYVTSDLKDNVFNFNNPKFIPYYIEGNNLVYFFMKVETEVFIMTMPEIDKYQYKRSIVCKSIEYMYMFHGVASANLLLKKGALDHYDTIFCVGPDQTQELRLEEQVRGLQPRNLVDAGYSLIDETIEAVSKMDLKSTDNRPKILIAPSWHDDNLLDNCIHEIIANLVGRGYNITLRPHPEYVKRYWPKMKAIIDKYEGRYENEFTIDMDYSQNKTVFSADAMITDWSTVCYEYSFSTKRPTLFINTPMKVMNPDYEALGKVPFDIKVRNEMGVAIEPSELDKVGDIIEDFLHKKEDYSKRISAVMEYALYNVGTSAQAQAEYIAGQIYKRREKKQNR